MPKTRAQKAESVARLTSALKAGKAAAFADYQGMSVQSVTALRKKLKAEGVDYIVAKKTLLTRSAKDAGYDIDFKSLPGMLGVAIAQGDEMAPTKVIGDAGKATSIKLVGGIFEGKFVDQAFVLQLSKLPSKKELLTQLLYVFNGPIGAFTRLLNAYREKQSGEAGSGSAEEGAPATVAAPEASTPEAPAAEATAAEAAPAPTEPAPEAPAPEASAPTA